MGCRGFITGFCKLLDGRGCWIFAGLFSWVHFLNHHLDFKMMI
jgi:hypothetical protein